MRTKTTALLVLVAFLASSLIVLLGPAKPTVGPESSARVNIAQSVATPTKNPFDVYIEKAAAAKAAAEKRERLAKERASREKARKALEAKKKAQARAAASKPKTEFKVKAIASDSGYNRKLGKSMAAARGWDGVQWTCLNNLWTRESGWSTGPSRYTNAYGIPQALPGSKMAKAGSDWRTNPETQIKWGLGYIKGRYGDPCSAWKHFLSHNWY